MTKLITVLLVILLLFCAWRGYVYWESFQREEQRQQAAKNFNPDSLPGMPDGLRESYNTAVQRGPHVVRRWLNTYGHLVEDPRKAWIQLDFCSSIARDNPAEARRLFAEVKERTREASPVWPRIKDLERSFE
jgi:hypothetical protein